MMLFLPCVLLFLGHALASPSANQYVETVIHSSLQNIVRSQKLDPASLRNFTIQYRDSSFNLQKANFSSGNITGISQVQRYSECDGPRNVSGSNTINCTLIFSKLKTSHKGQLKYGSTKINIRATGNVTYTLVNFGIVKSRFDSSPRVGTFVLKNYGFKNVTMIGLGPLSNYTRVLSENYEREVVAEIISILNYRFKSALSSAVASVPMPIR